MISRSCGMRTLFGLFLLLISLQSSSAQDSTASDWPLTKGNFWVYEGDVSWVEKDPVTGQNQVNHKHLTWRSEVVDVAQDHEAALLHGFPLDLAWYNSKTVPSDTLILLVGTDYYRVTNNAAQIFQQIKGPGSYQEPSPGHADTNTAELFLPTPLALNKRFGLGNSITELFSDRYCSLVENVTPFDLRLVKNAPKLDHPLCYSITCHTTPDNDQLDFVPGLGITAYSYLHHGTTMEVSLRLIDFGQSLTAKKP